MIEEYFQSMKEIIEQLINDTDDINEDLVSAVRAMLIGNITGDKTTLNGIKEALREAEDYHTVVEFFQNQLMIVRNSILAEGIKADLRDAAIEGMKIGFMMAVEEFEKEQNPTIYFELIHENAKVPTYAHETDAGADIYAVEDQVIAAGARSVKVPTGLKMAIPEGWQIAIRPRSGLSAKTNLRISNQIGTIDASYRGEVMVLFDNIGPTSYTIHAGDRIAQCIFEPVTHFNAEVVPTVASIGNDRGGGFGSTDAN